MKAMKKALALGLALAMVVTAVPVTNAQAATGVAKSKTYYVGKTYTLKLTTPKTWKSVKTTWTTSAKSVASISSKKTKSVKVTGVKKGTATVKAKVTYKKSGKKSTKTYSCKVTVKNPSVTMNAAAEVAVGAKVSAAVTKTAPKSALSTVTYATSDAAIATVDAKTGEVTGVKAGEATITATMTCGTVTKTASTKVTVKNVLLQSVKQTKYNAIEAVIAGNTKGLKNTDVVITNTATKATFPVSALSVDANDATKVTINTFGSMVDGKVYSVTLDGVTKEFTATTNEVKDVAVAPLEIVSGNDGEVVLGQTLGDNGVVLSESWINKNAPNVTFTVTTTEGYVNQDKLVLPKTGNKATAEITYHTYKYENGAEVGVISKKFEIVAVDAKPVTISGFAYTIGTSAPDWTKVTPKTQIAIGDSNMKAYFNFVDSNKKVVTDQYTVETSDNTTLLVGNDSITGGVSVVGIKEGNAYINVKDLKGNFVTSLPVTVVAARKLGRVELSSTSVTVTTKGTLTVNVKAFDQYGDELKSGVTTSADQLNNPAQAKVTVSAMADGKITVATDNAPEGTYQYRITVNGPANSSQLVGFSVRVIKPTKTVETATDLRLVVDNNVDMAVPDSATVTTTGAIKATIKVAAYDQGALLGYVALNEVKFNGKPVSAVSAGVTTEASIALTQSVSDAALTVYPAGTYAVSVKTADNKSFNGSITLKDSTEKAVITERISNEFAGVINIADKAGSAKTAIAACLKIAYKSTNKQYSTSELYVKDTDVSLTNKSVFVSTAYVKYTTAGGIDVWIPVDVNMTFTAK